MPTALRRPEMTPTKRAKLREADQVAKQQERGARRTRDDAKAAAWELFRRQTRGLPTDCAKYKRFDNELDKNLRRIEVDYRIRVRKIKQEHQHARSRIIR